MKTLCTTLILALALAAPAAAQDSRAEEIAREQAEKSKKLLPNVPSGTEKTLDWLEGYITDPNTVYLTFGGVYPSAGFAPGVALRRAFGPARMNVGGAYSLRNYKLLHGALSFPELANHKLEIDTTVRWVDATQVPFYGIGNESSKDARVNYGLRAFDVGASAAMKPVPWYRLGAGISWRQYEDREGAGSRPSIETFVPAPPPQLFDDAKYTHATVFTGIDWREAPGYTRRGGLYQVALHDFRDSNDQFSFRRVDAEVAQFLPILKEQWVLGFRALVQTTDVDDDQVVPYYLLPSLGGARRHRGYSDFRFIDRHVILLNAEYRWMPSRVLDMALFFDAGKVTRERRDLDFEDLKTAYGIGFRIHGPNFTPLRLDIAHGKEGARLHVTGNVSF